MKQVWIWLGVFAICAALGLTVGQSESTPMKALLAGSSQDLPEWRVKEVIGERKISEDDTVIFYMSEQKTLVMVRLHETWYGRWQHHGGSGSGPLPPSNGTSPKISPLGGTSYEDAWIAYGVIHSDEVDAVKVGNEAAHLVGDPGKMRVYVRVLPKFSGEPRVQAFDKQGRLLEER